MLPEIEAATTVRSGPAASIFPVVYHDLVRWIHERGYHAAAGPGREVWVNEVDDIADVAHHQARSDASSPAFQISGKEAGFARSGPGIAARRYASSEMPDQGKGPAIAISCPFVFYAGDAKEVQVRIGSLIVAIWLVIGGIAASHRGDYKGSMDCSRASTTAVTILAGPLNYAGVNLNINCSVHHLSN